MWTFTLCGCGVPKLSWRDLGKSYVSCEKAGKGDHAFNGDRHLQSIMTTDELANLINLYNRRNDIGQEEGSEWISQVSTLLHTVAPSQARELDEVIPYLFAGLSGQSVRPHWEKAIAIIRRGIAQATRVESEVPKQDAVAPSPGDGMGVLLSWSGSSSHALALVLRDWLPTVLRVVDPWMSSEDIPKGKLWDAELSERLQDTSYCIVCLTPGIAREPWVNYEAGSIGKFVDRAYVSPLLLGVAQDELKGLPLSRFQCTQFRKDEMHKLLRSINAAAGSPIPVDRLAEVFESSWTDLADKVAQIDLTEGQSSEVGGGHHTEDDHAALNEVEERILTLVARMGNDHPWVEDIATQISEDPTRTEYYLDNLEAGGYLYKLLSISEPANYGVTAQGRAYLVKNGLV